MKDECKKAIAQAYLFLDGEGLSEAERDDIQKHLHECAPCYERVGLDQEVTALISRLKGTTRCPKELKAKISALLDS
jgi:mycothiol system anti-sigma-R factor